jgi:hypothetical protein
MLASQGRIEAALARLEQGGIRMAGILDGLTAEVARNTSVEQSALTLIQGLAQQLKDAGTDPARLAALQTQLQANDDALAAAVAANTAAPDASSNPPASSQTTA